MSLLVRFAVALPLVIACSLRGAEDGLIDSPMFNLPPLPEPKKIPAWRGESELWLKALARPEAELRCRAADSFALAHQRGVKGMEVAVGPLVKIFGDPKSRPEVRACAARALIELDGKAASEAFFETAKGNDLELRELVEPALAKWDYRPARALWLARLKDREASARDRLLAARALAVVGETAAIEPLKELVVPSNREVPLRLDAAMSLGSLKRDGLEELARSLLGDPSRRGLMSRIAAVHLLRYHRGDASAKLLQTALKDPEPEVALLAAEYLLATDAALLLPSLDLLLSHREPGVRRVGVEVVRRLQDLDRTDRLVGRLGDDHVGVRTDARKALLELAKDGSRKERMIPSTMKALSSSKWEAQEQAAILLTFLDHKPTAPVLVGLLSNPRPEVFMAAAWGLRKLDVPETLPGALQYVDSLTKTESARDFVEWHDHQASQLNQFLGQRKYAPADGTMRKCVFAIPNQMIEGRYSAVWALGLIHEGKPVADLAAKFEERIRAARAPIPTEDLLVARMAAISLGRMKAEKHLGVLRQYYDKKPTFDPLNNACGWAIEQITGEKVPDAGEYTVFRRDWFLRSLSE